MARRKKNVKRAWGRDYIEDKRDRRFRLTARRTRLKVKLWELGEQTDQGSTPHCVGHSWYGWLTSEPIRQQPIVPDGIYTLAQLLDEWEGEDYDGTSVRAGAKVLKTTGHIAQYGWAWDVETAVTHVLTTSPIVLGVMWYQGMSRPDRNGLIKVSGRAQGGHAILCYGVDLNKEVIHLRNSWGSRWGKNGNCVLGLADFARLLDEQGECCTATEIRQQ